jgi:hypothetical protein
MTVKKKDLRLACVLLCSVSIKILRKTLSFVIFGIILKSKSRESIFRALLYQKYEEKMLICLLATSQLAAFYSNWACTMLACLQGVWTC